MATIPLSIHSLLLKPSVIVPQLSDYLSAAHTPQSGLIQGPQAQAKVQALRFYKKHLEKKFSNLPTKISTSKIIELPTENLSPIKVNLLTATILKNWVDDDDYAVSLESNDGYESNSWTCNNQLYVPFFFQVNNSLNFLTQSIQPYTNIAIVMEDFIGSSRVNYTCMASSKNRFVLPNLSIAINLSKCEKILCSLYKGKKSSYGSFYKDKWFLDSGISTHFTPFKSDFVNMTLDNYS